MKAVLIREPGPAENLHIGNFPDPEPGEQEILIRVAATALNRADILQRQGKYPPPPGESPVLGLEVAGTVVKTGPGVSLWQPGDLVCGLLGGGGYAEFAVLHEKMALPVPENLSLESAAAVPEVFLTAYQALHWIAGLQRGETVLIHAGASGVGTAAIQLCRASGAKAIVTASPEKHPTCLQLGASRAIDYKSEHFRDAALEFTDGNGVNAILDFIGSPYFNDNLESLAHDGRLVVLAAMGGIKAKDVNLGLILRNRLQITGTTLRARTTDYKIRLTAAFRKQYWPLFENGSLHPVIDSVYDWNDVVMAHTHMENNRNQGKIVLKILH
ncbi:MAG TPA: NAD(P)H-quinone oxidoreductase [Flavilitoribacter sp.]|nr:NAD(P)H-quinone oxidoreductase [Flavilitoribacter sp.]HMQ86950.1 NAD(P)H-quinone oxidoreductase [Flavilitoribacter sp.]